MANQLSTSQDDRNDRGLSGLSDGRLKTNGTVWSLDKVLEEYYMDITQIGKARRIICSTLRLFDVA